MRLRGKVALLTGAAAAIKGELMGFGGAAAHLFVREGAKVVLTDIRDDLGERAHGLQLDQYRCFDQQIDEVLANRDPIIHHGDPALLFDA